MIQLQVKASCCAGIVKHFNPELKLKVVLHCLICTGMGSQRPAKYLNHRGMPKQTDGYPVFLKPIGICFKHLQPLGPDLLKIRDQNCPHMIWIL